MIVQKVPTCTKSHTFAVLTCVLFTGCAARPPVTVSVPVPVECKEQVPDRPIMPTETLLPGAAPFVVLRSALAEIDRREGYELRMRAALVACTAPIEVAP